MLTLSLLLPETDKKNSISQLYRLKLFGTILEIFCMFKKYLSNQRLICQRLWSHYSSSTQIEQIKVIIFQNLIRSHSYLIIFQYSIISYTTAPYTQTELIKHIYHIRNVGNYIRGQTVCVIMIGFQSLKGRFGWTRFGLLICMCGVWGLQVSISCIGNSNLYG